jgi:phosphopantothenoylcysteine decarboxylase/phosphopantothenate--cysteine ligase
MTLRLVQNMDILRTMGERKRPDQFLVGFAAETHELAASAVKKIEKKNLDMIAANLVGGKDTGFQADTNQMTVFLRDGSQIDIPLMDKPAVAHAILDTILAQLLRRR